MIAILLILSTLTIVLHVVGNAEEYLSDRREDKIWQKHFVFSLLILIYFITNFVVAAFDYSKVQVLGVIIGYPLIRYSIFTYLYNKALGINPMYRERPFYYTLLKKKITIKKSIITRMLKLLSLFLGMYISLHLETVLRILGILR